MNYNDNDDQTLNRDTDDLSTERGVKGGRAKSNINKGSDSDMDSDTSSEDKGKGKNKDTGGVE